MGLQAADAEDAVQETMIRIVVRASMLETLEAGALVGYALCVARGVIADLRRREGRRCRLKRAHPQREGEHERDEAACSEHDTFEIVSARQALARIERRLQSMREGDREVLLLAGALESTAVEVAELLGIPEGTVASRLRRSRAFVRTEVDE
jgi:RNA polymerase sigma-70 factor (ECF subfamily)